MNPSFKLPAFFCSLLIALPALTGLRSLAAETSINTAAAESINALGIDLYRKAAGGNLLLSPFSIQSALAMTYAGAGGVTRDEMRTALHYPEGEKALHTAMKQLFTDLEKTCAAPIAGPEVKSDKKSAATPTQLRVANRLFGDRTMEIKLTYQNFVRDHYGAGIERMDFLQDAEASRAKINRWVEEQTHDKIRELLAPHTVEASTRLVLVNALYFRSAWAIPFPKRATRPAPFFPTPTSPVQVRTMSLTHHFGHAQKEGFQAITLPYADNELQFLVLLPDPDTELARLESKLTPGMLTDCARLTPRLVSLYLPKLRMEPPTLDLSKMLMELGMPTAFSDKADFKRIAEEPLMISRVVHKTFLDLDESATEAAAATAVVMITASAPAPPSETPLVVRVDRPFIFALQHRATGTCLFLGRMTNPL